MDKKIFFNTIRSYVTLDENVKGFDLILDYLEKNEDSIPQAGYIIATAYWETAKTMEPVREAFWLSEDWRKKNLRYYPYYGRGYVQLTWEYNYKKASDYFGVDFVKNPDLIMDPKYALPVLFVGMNEGWFTGKDLDDYIHDSIIDFLNSRRIINGTDKAKEIAKLAKIFTEGLQKAGYALKQTQEAADENLTLPSTTIPTTPENAVSGSLWERIFSTILKFLKGK